MNITTVKADLTGILHGTSLNQVQNLDGVLNRAARQLLLDIDPQETKRIVALTNPIYNSVYDYALPTDVKGNRIIDIRPQVNRTNSYRFSQKYNQDFDLDKGNSSFNSFTVQFNGSIKTIRIDAPILNTGITVNECDSVSGNGTWVASGGATDLATETQNYVSASSALKINLSAASSPGYLTNSTISSVDMSDHEDVSSLFFYVYLPTASVFTSLALKWGTDASNYWTGTATTTHEGNSFTNGWNLIRVNWSSATEVGTPDSSDVSYAQVTFTYDGTAQTGVILDNIVSRKGLIHEIVYYSKYLFRDSSTNAFQETITDNSNLVNLDTESYDMFLNQAAFLIAQQVQGADALRFDAQFFADKYLQSINRYKGLYKSEVIKPRQQYYKQTNPSYRNLL